MSYAFLCSGQGDQHSGMGTDLMNGNKEFLKRIEYYDSVLSEVDLINLLTTFSDTELKKTENAQIATYAMSVALGDLLISSNIKPTYYAGLSLGEFSALTLSGALTVEDGLSLVYKRGKLMGEFSERGTCMYAILGMDPNEINQILNEMTTHSMSISNYNSKRQTVISGKTLDEELLKDRFIKNGALDVSKLNVSGPFHTDFYREISKKFHKELKSINWNRNFEYGKVIKNSTANTYKSTDNFAEILSNHMCAPVLWKQSINYIKSNKVYKFIEVGPSSTLRNLNKDISKKKITTYLTNNSENVDLLCGALVND
ncbi:ACP S-malonyltransferase [Paraliobacillus sp. JSM ZJ581]|uniref:ACP S-malonyltransferase n=1 Tax=Paraliobacillus sp. JSM ZJ581 TaxID=3342118 RepID=UPI0035A85110